MTTATVGEPQIFGLLDAPDNHAQRGFLHSYRYRNNLLGGRGLGKTYAAIAKNAIFCASLQPGSVSYITEQVGPDVVDTLLPVQREVVPSEWYRITRASQGKFDIEWANGSLTRCRSRQSKRSTDEPPFRGPSAQYICHDEAGLDRFRLDKTLQVSEGMLRGGDLLCLDTVSTPKLGGLHDYLRRLGLVGDSPEQISEDGQSAAFYGRTSDNAYNDNLDERLRSSYSPEFAAQELDAKWVSLSGRIWQNWSDAEWPAGNVYPHAYNERQGYVLAVDLGVKSAWGIWQRIPARDPRSGRILHRRALDCLCAEWQPDHGNARDMIDAIDKRYGRPSLVIAGADVHTRGVSDGTKPSLFITSRWPGVPLQTPTSYLVDKETQHWAMQSAICNSYGQRQLVISSECEFHTPDSGRTFPDLMRLDSWPEGALAHGRFFEKDKASGGSGLEDERDMVLYYVALAHPPEARKEGRIR